MSPLKELTRSQCYECSCVGPTMTPLWGGSLRVRHYLQTRRRTGLSPASRPLWSGTPGWCPAEHTAVTHGADVTARITVIGALICSTSQVRRTLLTDRPCIKLHGVPKLRSPFSKCAINIFIYISHTLYRTTYCTCFSVQACRKKNSY